jgi:hypothetical protein
MPSHTFSGGGRKRSTWVNLPKSPNRIVNLRSIPPLRRAIREALEKREERLARRRKRYRLLRLKRMTPTQRKAHLAKQRRERRAFAKATAKWLATPGYVPSPGAIEFERKWKNKYDPHKMAYRNGIVARRPGR